MTSVPRWISDTAAYTAIVLLVTGIAFGILRGLPFLASVERWVADYQIATLTPPEPQHPSIIFVAINEQTLEHFPYRSPVDRQFLSDLLQLLASRGVRGILLDVLFDQSTEADKDLALKNTLDSLPVPIAVSYGRQPESLTDRQVEYIDAFLKLENRGFANLVTDRFNDTVRWIYPGRALPDGTFVPGVVGRLLSKLDISPPSQAVALAFRGRPDRETESFRSFPAQAVKLLPAAWFKDKIVVIGADLSLTDRHRSPYAAAEEGKKGVIAGALFHAYALAQLLDGRSAPEVEWAWALGVVGFCSMVGIGLGKIPMGLILRLAAALAGIGFLWFAGFSLYHYRNVLIPLVTPSLSLVLSVWLIDVYTGRQERNQKKFVQTAFSKYISSAVLDEVLKDPTKLSLDAQRRELSMIFTDVAGFTTISEKMDAQILSSVLNKYFDGMCSIIFDHGGTVDKFIGDAVFVIFNAPQDIADHPEKAVSCALALDRFSEGFREDQESRGRRFGVTRIGVHTGWASIGNFGSHQRFEYTALGDAVNTAARLEGLNKYFGTRVCVSGAAMRKAKNNIFYRPLGDVVLKGKTEPLDVFEPMSLEVGSTDYIQDYLRAFALLSRGNPEAEEKFRRLHELNPEDGVVSLHLERMGEGLHTKLIRMTDK